MDPNQKLPQYDSSSPVDPTLYRTLIGSLIWLLNTRMDLSFPVGLLSSFMQKPLQCHWQQDLRILRYLQQTQDLGIWFAAASEDSPPILRGWSDSHWGGDPIPRVLLQGMCSLLVLVLFLGAVRSS